MFGTFNITNIENAVLNAFVFASEHFGEEGYDVNQIIEQSIANGYQGLFKPREKPKDDNDGWSFKYKEGWSW